MLSRLQMHPVSCVYMCWSRPASWTWSPRCFYTDAGNFCCDFFFRSSSLTFYCLSQFWALSYSSFIHPSSKPLHLWGCRDHSNLNQFQMVCWENFRQSTGFSPKMGGHDYSISTEKHICIVRSLSLSCNSTSIIIISKQVTLIHMLFCCSAFCKWPAFFLPNWNKNKLG